VAFSPKGRRVALAVEIYRKHSNGQDPVFSSAEVWLWDLATGRQTLVVKGLRAWPTNLKFSPQGNYLGWIGELSQDKGTLEGELVVRDLKAGRWVFRDRWKDLLHEPTFVGPVFSSDGRSVAYARNNGFPPSYKVSVRDTRTGKEYWRLSPTSDVSAVAFSPDSRRLACDSATEVGVWDVTAARKVGALRGRVVRQDPIRIGRHQMDNCSLVFSPDGIRLACPGPDKMVRVWEITTGEVLILKGHTGDVWRVGFSPDGKRLASAGKDAVRIWDTAFGQELLALPAAAEAVAFSRDGLRLLGFGTKVTVWDAAPYQAR
jgi:WD40 repeat protein